MNSVQIARLREATAEDHASVEGGMSLMAPDLDRETYLATLQRIFGVVSAWESFAEAAAPPELRELVRARARRRLLENDIRSLAGTVSPAATALFPETLQQIRGRSAFLGAMYVMEGSRLGGQFIARHVDEVLDLDGEHGTTYFRGFGERTGSMWKELIAVLERDIPEEETERTIQAAKEMFRVFGEWMRNAAPKH